LCNSLFIAPAFAAGPRTGSSGPRTVDVSRKLGAIPVSGACTNKNTGAVGTFTGTLTITKFVVQDGALVAQGLVSGTCSVDGSITDVPVTLPVATPQHTCTILTLNLGPLHLDLLGLVVDLSPVTLVITAVPGPGNLLGNLLCAIAHLLDGGGSRANVARLLNVVLFLIG
jgi:hypothetical protein